MLTLINTGSSISMSRIYIVHFHLNIPYKKLYAKTEEYQNIICNMIVIISYYFLQDLSKTKYWKQFYVLSSRTLIFKVQLRKWKKHKNIIAIILNGIELFPGAYRYKTLLMYLVFTLMILFVIFYILFVIFLFVIFYLCLWYFIPS